MKLKDKLKAAKSALELKFLKRKFPLAVNWAITNRCNFQCKYCDRWKRNSYELSTKESLEIISQLSKLGCSWISFTGGEPLLREDIGELLDYCKEKCISTTINSNGSLIPKKIREIRNVDLIKLSLDGPEEVNDFIRSKGAFNKTMSALKIIKNAGMKVALSAVLTKYNVNYIDFMLDIAQRYNVKIMFSPVNHIHSKNTNIDFLFPEKKEFLQAIDKLIEKRKENKSILNSYTYLRYVKDWPNFGRVPCFAGKAFCYIATDGRMYPCVAMEDKVAATPCSDNNLEKIFRNIQKDISCGGCWCKGTFEFNQLLASKLDTILTICYYLLI